MVIAILTQTFELHQMHKLPVLFQHFAEHQQRDASVGFIAYLSMHYWGQDMNDDDDSRDQQLPFKKLDVDHVHVNFIPGRSGVKIKATVFRIAFNYPRYGLSYICNPELSGLFRPPRV